MIVKEKAERNIIYASLIKVRNSELLWILTFTLLTAFAAQVAVPVQPVPFTLQTMLVILSGAFLGSRGGAYSQIIYLFAGIAGLPVFAGFSFGFASLFGPTGGYLLSFPFAAYFVGYIIEKRNNLPSVVIAFFTGQIMILLSGASYLALFMRGNFGRALFSGAVIFSAWDLIKTVAAVSIYKSFTKK
jgi:biotin transport system substrate-specific component